MWTLFCVLWGGKLLTYLWVCYPIDRISTQRRVHDSFLFWRHPTILHNHQVAYELSERIIYFNSIIRFFVINGYIPKTKSDIFLSINFSPNVILTQKLSFKLTKSFMTLRSHSWTRTRNSFNCFGRHWGSSKINK